MFYSDFNIKNLWNSASPVEDFVCKSFPFKKKKKKNLLKLDSIKERNSQDKNYYAMIQAQMHKSRISCAGNNANK